MTFNATSETSLSSSCVGSLLESKDIFQLSRHGLKISKTNLIPAICFYNGSFAPFHAGHLNVLQEAKQYIDNLGTHEFIGAYISPSHSSYAARKLDPEERIGTGHRLAMIQLAIKNFDWIMIDLFETFQSHQTSLYVILKTFISRVRSQLFHDAERIDIFWLKGEDALRYSLSDKFLQLGCHSVYILNRGLNEAVTTSNNASTIVQNCYQKRWEEMRRLSSFPERFHLIQAKNLNLSSTAIRTCAQSSSVTYEQLQSFTQLDSITSYILQHHLWGAQANVSSLIVSSLTVCPRDITELTSEILSQMLCSLSTRSIKVTSFMSKRIGIGRGWGGPLYHLYNIQYLPVVTDISLPNDMVLKLSTGIWNGIAASIEAEFYVKLAPRISHVEVPHCYYAARRNHNSNDTVLLLEDLSLTFKPLSRSIFIDDSTLFLLVTTIASLHAEFFEHPMLKHEEFTWLPTLSSNLSYHHTKYQNRMSDQNYIKLLQSKLSSKAYTYATTLLTHFSHLFHKLSNEKYTVSHGDFWINNVLMHRDQSQRFVIIDWQTCCRANGLIDIAYLLRMFNSERARSIESHVLELYHKVLVKYGVSQYDISSIKDDYYTLALPFIFIRYCCWNHTARRKINEIACLLEDIVTYIKTNKRLAYNWELDLYEPQKKDRNLQ